MVVAGAPPSALSRAGSQSPFVPHPALSHPCRILCYGDSLTAGYYANGKRFSPYGNVLQESLRSLGLQCEISICGISGRRADEMVAELDSPVCRDMVGKLGKGLAYILDREGPYDLVILMAGTNDFVPNVNLKMVRDSVCRLHSVCHARGVPTVMLAAPCNIAEMRVGLGRLLKDWARKNPSKVLGFLDPEDVMPRSNAACWEADQVHFTPTGSRTLGGHLSPIIAQILQKLGRTARGTHGQSPKVARSMSATHGQSPKVAAHSRGLSIQTIAATPASKQVLHRHASQLAAPLLVATPVPPRLFSRGGA